jgi:hypothetical protein
MRSLGKMGKAQAHIGKPLAIDPTLRCSNLAGIVPFRAPADAERYTDGVRKAGLPAKFDADLTSRTNARDRFDHAAVAPNLLLCPRRGPRDFQVISRPNSLSCLLHCIDQPGLLDEDADETLARLPLEHLGRRKKTRAEAARFAVRPSGGHAQPRRPSGFFIGGIVSRRKRTSTRSSRRARTDTVLLLACTVCNVRCAIQLTSAPAVRSS